MEINFLPAISIAMNFTPNAIFLTMLSIQQHLYKKNERLDANVTVITSQSHLPIFLIYITYYAGVILLILVVTRQHVFGTGKQ